MSGIFIPTLRASPSPRVSLCLLLSTWLRRAYMARSLAHEAQIRDQQHSSKAWRRGNWHSKPPDFSFREKAALEQSDPPALACVLFDLLLRSLTFALSSAGTQGLPAPRIARASRIATIKSWEFFPAIRERSLKNFHLERILTKILHNHTGPKSFCVASRWF